MPRRARALVGGYAYHVLNRANGRLRLFRKAVDLAELVTQACERVPLGILCYLLMNSHWH